jgi:S-adenosylmethionine:tRNA ribosyltransferase-isomerase
MALVVEMARMERLDFELPPELEAHEPPEARGLARDGVRLMVSRQHDLSLEHARFADLPRLLDPGSLLVFNRSATLPAAVEGMRPDGRPVTVHFSTPAPHGSADEWTIEMRAADVARPLTTPSLARVGDGHTGEVLRLPGGGSVELVRGYPDGSVSESSRLWVARLDLPGPALEFLARYGRPIRYGHIRGEWPIGAYQTVYGDQPGSAEMPSAGRPFTPELLAALHSRGVETAFLTLHTGVSSQEADETPFAEWFEVPAETAAAVNRARGSGRPVVGVGTTVVRALESAGGQAARGWTEVVITPERGVRYVDGLITGWHEPQASHLLMLEAIAGRPLLEVSYAEAIRRGYLWHEFGDSQLILP